jgi:inorganic triphosphatase YgiF
MHELELKLIIGAEAAQLIWRRAVSAGLAGTEPPQRLLASTYFDTADQKLRKAGIAIRLRRDGKRLVQTVKARASIHGGVSRAIEIETELPGPELDLSLIASAAMRKRIGKLAGKAMLEPVVTTEVRRAEAAICHPSGTRALMAVDEGLIKAGGSQQVFRELEIEYLEGPVEGLFAIADEVLPPGRLKVSQMSKADRGFLLAETGQVEPAPAPRPAGKVRIERDAVTGLALQDILRECSAQIIANIEAIMALDAPEGPHQLRVGLRRLRSALALFRPAASGEMVDRLKAEARWLAVEVGQLRDLQVIVGEIVPRHSGAHADHPGMTRLAVAATSAADSARTSLRQTLDGPRVRSFLLGLMCFTECRGWEVAKPSGVQDSVCAAPVSAFVAAALAKRWRKVCKCARRIGQLSVDQRHALRKELKKLRYAAEFFRSLFPDRRVKPFLASLRRLQDLFGELNDAAMLEARLDQLAAQMPPDPDARFAAGLLIGSASARADIHWHEARVLWKALKRQRLFWE